MKKGSRIPFYDYRKKILSGEKSQIQLQTEPLLSIALVFPNSYAVGMANLGFQSIYRLLNDIAGVRCERAFYYDNYSTITQTLESGTELRHFDLIAFSVSFELDLPNIIHILINSGITALAENRHQKEPIILAGGAITFLNPAPLAPFVDLMMIGEIETQLTQFFSGLIVCKKNRLEKNELITFFKDLPGIFVRTQKTESTKIIKLYSNLKQIEPQFSPIVSPDSHFKNMFLVEVGRGCGRRCFFCAASHIYHPFRLFSIDQILATISRYNKNANRIGLVGAAISDDPKINQLCQILVDRNFALGLSSFRLDKLTPSFLNILEKGKVNSISLAPEAGSEWMRLLIHKKLSHQKIIDAAEFLEASPINRIKLYFLIGLPHEQWEDIEAIVQLVDEMQRKLFKRKRNKTLSISINAFIPKPWTPFQWAPMEKAAEILRKRKYLASNFKKMAGVGFSQKSGKEEVLQGIISLGDEKVGLAMYNKIKNNLDWKTVWQQADFSIEKLLYSERMYTDLLPWDFIDTGIDKLLLWKTWKMNDRDF